MDWSVESRYYANLNKCNETFTATHSKTPPCNQVEALPPILNRIKKKYMLYCLLSAHGEQGCGFRNQKHCRCAPYRSQGRRGTLHTGHLGRSYDHPTTTSQAPSRTPRQESIVIVERPESRGAHAEPSNRGRPPVPPPRSTSRTTPSTRCSKTETSPRK